MSENTKLWDILGRTDPAHTKAFTRGGGFKGTAIKPIWSYRRMTEQFGPCGQGWGIGEPSFQVVPGPEGEVLVFCTVGVWYVHEERSETIYGVGGDKAVGKNKYGLNSDDEAFKKAFTDAVTNALKLIGVGADVHMGLFDDSKYVAEMRDEFSEEPEKQKRQVGYRDDGTRTSFALKKEQPELMPDLRREANECKTLVSLEKLKVAYREKAAKEKWNPQFKAVAKEIFLQRETEIRAEMERLSEASPDELAEVPAREAFEHSVYDNPLGAG